MSLRAGQRIRLDILALISDGRGLARHEGRAVFVAGALPGERVEAEVTGVRARLAEAALVETLEAAPDARPVLCPHGGRCGGCAWQAMAYPQQLAWKRRFLFDALQRIGRVADPPVLPILPSPAEWGYRNKMEFAFAGRGDGLTLGLRRRNAREVIDVHGCLLQSGLTMRVAAAARMAARRSGLASWSREEGGLWRFLVIREPAAGGCLAELILAPHEQAARHGRAVAEAVLAACPEVDGFVLSERAAPSDMAYGEKTRLALGRTVLEEDLGGVRLRIGAGAFFQVNTPAAALLYAEVARLAGGQAGCVWDVYCGVGSIGLYLARNMPEPPVVSGIEQSGRAVRLARENAAALRVRAVYRQGAAARMLGAPAKARGGTPDLVVVDPPRAGLEAGAAAALCRLRPERVLYVSCDPATLARDAALLAPYRLEAVRPVDLFPQTPHVESVALFVLEK